MDWLKRLFGGSTAGAGSPSRPPQPERKPVLNAYDLRAIAERCGVEAAAEDLVALAAPVFHIIAGPSATDAPLGETRLGGAPDLPPDSAWPRGRFGAATFLGQFDLADVRARTGSDLLPPSGLLSLFIVEIESAADPVEILSILTPAGSPLHRLTPPATEDFGDDIGLLKPISIAAFVPGLSLSRADIGSLSLGTRCPGADLFELEAGVSEPPPGAIGQWLGRGFDGHDDDQRQVAHARRIDHPGIERYAFISDWSEWERLKQIANPLANGMIHRPWKTENDPEVRWLMDNRATFDAGVETLRLLLRVESNRPMDLWINDADPIYVMVDSGRLADGELSELHATVTQG